MENKETPNINLTPIVDPLVKKIKPLGLKFRDPTRSDGNC